MNIHQLNIQYLPQEDRLLARVNTSTALEFRLWLTRRLTIGLLPLLRKVSADQLQRSVAGESGETGLAAKDPKVRELLAEFKKEQTLQQADFKTPFKPPAADSPLEDPILVSEVQLTPLATGHVELKFLAKNPSPSPSRELKMVLDSALMQGLSHLLEKAFRESQWGQTALPDAEAAVSPSDAIGASRPQYLN